MEVLVLPWLVTQQSGTVTAALKPLTFIISLTLQMRDNELRGVAQLVNPRSSHGHLSSFLSLGVRYGAHSNGTPEHTGSGALRTPGSFHSQPASQSLFPVYKMGKV